MSRYEGFEEGTNLADICGLKEPQDGCFQGVDRVAKFYLSDDKKTLRIRECCDDYFWADLDKDAAIKLLRWLVDRVETME